MDQTFNFRAAPEPWHRRLNPRAIAFAVAAFLVVTGFVAFALWVAESERRSLERTADADVAAPMVGTMAGNDEMTTGDADPDHSIDAAARSAARTALNAARQAARGRATFLDAGPGQLTPLASELIFVDGPSQAPGVVSVASTRDVWGSAVMGPSGTCYLVRFSPVDGVSYGTGVGCTGGEALTIRGSSW